MKLAYFPNQIAQNGTEVLKSLISSAQKFGIETTANDLDADIAVIWSVLWRGRMAGNKAVYQHYRSQGKSVAIIDVGALHRNQTWKIALNHITNQGYYGHRESLDRDRPKKLGINLKPCVDRDPGILLAAQHTSSLQVQDVNLTAWLDSKIAEIRQMCDRPLILRPHPRCRMDLQRFRQQKIEIQHPLPVHNTYDSFDLNMKYHAIVNYNSGPGVQASIAGVRSIVDPSSLAHPVSIKSSEIDAPYDKDRDQWLIEICHTEYTLEEISQGQWITRLHLV